ncbi:MAG TPA: hypothetical protein VN931_12525 [Fibrobacteria bacterium]|nr:hypothetical protein [Fibrobacteria bacterium]
MNPIQGTPQNSVQPPPPPVVPKTAAGQDSAAHEAMETASQTKAEAAKGDQQATRKLALAAAHAHKAPPPPVKTPTTGNSVNVTA